MPQMRVVLAQIVPVLGDVQDNLRMRLDMIEEARAQDVQLPCFPELSLTGYLLRDLAPGVAVMATESDPIMAQVIPAFEYVEG